MAYATEIRCWAISSICHTKHATGICSRGISAGCMAYSTHQAHVTQEAYASGICHIPDGTSPLEHMPGTAWCGICRISSGICQQMNGHIEKQNPWWHHPTAIRSGQSLVCGGYVCIVVSHLGTCLPPVGGGVSAEFHDRNIPVMTFSDIRITSNYSVRICFTPMTVVSVHEDRYWSSICFAPLVQA